MIYFATVQFDREIHAQGLGFTRHVYDFVQAEDQTLAEKAIRQHYKKPDTFHCGELEPPQVDRVTMRPANRQNASYTNLIK